jgi:hypothetical protein
LAIYLIDFPPWKETIDVLYISRVPRSTASTFNSHHCDKMSSHFEEKAGSMNVHNEAITSPPGPTEVPWWKQPYLRQLYFMMGFLFLGSTTLGYDGSLLNGLQTMTTWQDCMHHPTWLAFTVNWECSFQPPSRLSAWYLRCDTRFRWTSSSPIRPLRRRHTWKEARNCNWVHFHPHRFPHPVVSPSLTS